jgi:hypothetical protein
MTEAILARVRNRIAAQVEPMHPTDPWTAVAHMFAFIMERFAGYDTRFAALEARPTGLGILDAHIDQTGSFILKFTDGSQKNVGLVVGRDAPPATSLEFQRDSDGRIVRSVLR